MNRAVFFLNIHGLHKFHKEKFSGGWISQMIMAPMKLGHHSCSLCLSYVHQGFQLLDQCAAKQHETVTVGVYITH